MSKENLEQFMQKVAGSEDLQSAIGKGLDAESLITLSTEHGFEFTAEELAESAELSDEELDGVAGGFGVHSVPGGLGVDDTPGKPITYIERFPDTTYTHVYKITG
jgi:predicted ribosomally synthesized peptide with nif11-like leader